MTWRICPECGSTPRERARNVGCLTCAPRMRYTTLVSQGAQRRLRRVIAAAQEVVSWCYVHHNTVSLRKMRTLRRALDRLSLN
jgi:hypothetical protein